MGYESTGATSFVSSIAESTATLVIGTTLTHIARVGKQVHSLALDQLHLALYP